MKYNECSKCNTQTAHRNKLCGWCCNVCDTLNGEINMNRLIPKPVEQISEQHYIIKLNSKLAKYHAGLAFERARSMDDNLLLNATYR